MEQAKLLPAILHRMLVPVSFLTALLPIHLLMNDLSNATEHDPSVCTPTADMEASEVWLLPGTALVV